MPKPTVRNRRKSSHFEGREAGSWADPSRVTERYSCDLCSSLVSLYEREIDGQRIVVCRGCAASAEVDVSEWKRVKGEREIERTGTPDLKALRQMGFRPRSGRSFAEINYAEKRKFARHHPLCAYRSCGKRVSIKGGVACWDHWAIIPESLKRPLLDAQNNRKGDLRTARQAVVRYLEMRSRFAARARSGT